MPLGRPILALSLLVLVACGSTPSLDPVLTIERGAARSHTTERPDFGTLALRVTADGEFELAATLTVPLSRLRNMSVTSGAVGSHRFARSAFFRKRVRNESLQRH